MILERFDSFVGHNDTVVNVLKMVYAITSIGFEMWMRRTRPVATATPSSRELRPSFKLDNSTVKAIHKFAEESEKELLEYLLFLPSSVKDAPEKISTVAVGDDPTSALEEKMSTATTAVSVKLISTSTES